MALPAELLTAIQAAYDGALSRDEFKFEYSVVGTGPNRKKVYVWIGWSPVENSDAPGDIWVRVFSNVRPGR